MTYRRLHPARARRALLVVLAGLAVSVTGCDRDDPAAAAIDKAALDLQTLAPGSLNPPSAAYRRTVYNSVLDSLRAVGDDATKAQTAAAALLAAQAHGGLAEEPAQQATDLERTSLNYISEIRALLGQWSGLNALAAASASYDPTKELADIEEQARAREQERVEQQKRKAAVDEQVAGIRAEAKAKADAARAKQQEAGTLRSQLPDQTAVQGEQTLRRAQELSREADAFEADAANLEAEAAKIAPQSNEIQLEIDRLSAQLELLRQAREQVQRRNETAQASAAQARAEAAKVAEAIRSRIAALDELRSGELAKAFEEAQRHLESAAAAAKRAVGESRSAGQMAHGAAQQSLGDLHWGRAQGIAAYADLLTAIATAKPPVPGSEAYQAKAAELQAAAKEQLEAATAAYEAANDAYQASGSQEQDRMNRINERLAKAVSITSGGAKDIRIQDAAPSDGETPGEISGEGSASIGEAGDSPQATVQALIDMQRTGNAGNVADLFVTNNDQERRALQAFMSLTPKQKRLENAMKAKFGTGLDAMAGQMGGNPMDLAQYENLNASDLQFDIQGDTAEAAIPGVPDTIKLRRQDGRWRVDLAAMGVPLDQLVAMAAMAPAMGQALDEVTADIEAGKYPNAQAAMMALGQKLMGTMAPPGGGR